MPRSRIPRSYGNSIFSFLRNFTVFQVAERIYIPVNSVNRGGSLSSTSSSTLIICRFSDDGQSDRHEVICHSFDLHFSNILKYILILNSHLVNVKGDIQFSRETTMQEDYTVWMQ